MDDNIFTILNIKNQVREKINENAFFNTNKKLHPSYLPSIPSLKPILPKTTIPKFPVKNTNKIAIPSPGSKAIPNKISIPSPKVQIPIPKTNKIPIPNKTPIKSSKQKNLQTISVTNLKPNIPRIDSYPNEKRMNVTDEKIIFPEAKTMIDSPKIRPMIIYEDEKEAPKILSVDDIYRKFIKDSIDLNKLQLSKTRVLANNKTYNLEEIKDIAKDLGISTANHKKAEIVDKIIEKALKLGFNV